VIICDIHMPVVSGEQVARMIRSTNNHNQNTPSKSFFHTVQDRADGQSSQLPATSSPTL
jgi:CheY-like chemotaxis protein